MCLRFVNKVLHLNNVKYLCLQFSSISSASSSKSEYFIIQVLLQYDQFSTSTTAMSDSKAMSNLPNLPNPMVYSSFNIQTIDSSVISSCMVTHGSRLKLAAGDHSRTISLYAAVSYHSWYSLAKYS